MINISFFGLLDYGTIDLRKLSDYRLSVKESNYLGVSIIGTRKKLKKLQCPALIIRDNEKY